MSATVYWRVVCRTAIALASFAAVGESAAEPNCYRSYDGTGRLVYEGRQPPAGLSDASPGAASHPRMAGPHVVWFPSSTCRGDDVGTTRISPAPLPSGTSPAASVLLRRVPDSSYTTRGGRGDAGEVAASSLSWRGGDAGAGGASPAAPPAGGSSVGSSAAGSGGSPRGYSR